MQVRGSLGRMRTFEGALTALVTPFRGGEIDEAALRSLVERQIDGGIDGLVPCGTTGESVTLSTEEHARVVRIVVETARGRVPVVAGAGSVSTAHTIALAEIARDAKADGVLVVVPYYNRPTQAGLLAHFGALFRAVSLPTVVYNIPGRTGTDLSADSFCELVRRHPEVVAIKEATGNVLRAQELAARCGDRISVLSGDDALTLAVVACGGRGVISVTSNVAPREVAEVVRAARAGDSTRALTLHRKLLPLHEAMFVESNPAPVKAALAALFGTENELRLPLVAVGEDNAQRVRAALRAFGFGV